MRTLKSLPLLALLCLAPAAAGCGNLENDRIDSICNCENCGDREVERRAIEVETDLAVAETYGCTELLEPYWECQLDRHECDNNQYRDDDEECDSQYEQFQDCLHDQSSRERGPYWN